MTHQSSHAFWTQSWAGSYLVKGLLAWVRRSPCNIRTRGINTVWVTNSPERRECSWELYLPLAFFLLTQRINSLLHRSLRPLGVSRKTTALRRLSTACCWSIRAKSTLTGASSAFRRLHQLYPWFIKRSIFCLNRIKFSARLRGCSRYLFLQLGHCNWN